MISRFIKIFGVPLLALSLGLTPTPVYPIFSYLSAFRDLCTSRISGASDEDLELLEQIDDPAAQSEAAWLRMTYADVASPFVSMAVGDTIKQYVSTPFSYIGCKSGFSTLYGWFSKKIKRVQIIPSLIQGALSSMVIFAMMQIMSEKFYPNWVNKNYYAKTVASRLSIRLAMVCGMFLMGASATDPEVA